MTIKSSKTFLPALCSVRDSKTICEAKNLNQLLKAKIFAEEIGIKKERISSLSLMLAKLN